jgi:glycosyltransferase involved in cell wall biosynthesis
VFVSEQLRAIARAAVPALAGWLDDAIVQPMGIAIERFRAIPRAPSSPPTIVTASRLVPLKGIDVAIAAMAHIHAPARLVIAGDGPERAALAARGTPRVAFLGEVPAARRDDLLREASVVVVPSRVMPSGRTEGTPMIALEALAAGVPVVASAVGGLVDLDGLRLVAPDDPRALAAAIDRAIAHPPAPELLRQSVAHLDWQTVARRIL